MHCSAFNSWTTNHYSKRGISLKRSFQDVSLVTAQQAKSKLAMEKVYTAPQRKKSLVREIFVNLISLTIVLAAVGGVVAAYLMQTPPPNRPPDSLIPLVKTAATEIYQGPLFLTLSGTVVPHREIKIAAEVGGIVLEKSPECRAGNYVRSGTRLLTIDKQNYELEYKTIEAELSQSTTMIGEVEEEIRGLNRMIELGREELALIRKEVDRNTKLTNVVSRTEADQAERNLLTAQSQLSTRENNLNTATARLERMKAASELVARRLERAKLNLARTEIFAPSDGVVVTENVQQGDLVAVGSPLIVFEDTQRAEVAANLTATDLAWIRQNLTAGVPGKTTDEANLEIAYQLPKTDVKVFDPSEPDVVWSGFLSRFDGIGRNELTKTIPIRITIDNPVIESPTGPRPVVRGMYVKCRLEVSAEERSNQGKLLSLPKRAIKPGGTVWGVQDLKLFRRKVQIVHEFERVNTAGETEKMAIVRLIDDGLKPGDRVVVSPLSQPAEGTVVELLNDRPATAAADDQKPTSTTETTPATVESNPKRNEIDSSTGRPEQPASSKKDS